MARKHGKDWTTITFAGTSIKPDVVSIDFNVSAEMHETTTIGDQWKEFTSGLKGGDTITVNAFYENTATTGIWDLFTSRLGGTENNLVLGDGTKTITIPAIVQSCPLPIDVGDMVKFNPVLQVSGAVTFA
jgi:hypothetical protein